MNRRMLAAAAAGLAMLAVVPSAAQQSGSHNPAVKDSDPHTVAAPARGSNSFTEDQARKRLTKAGYTNITGLTKTEAGIWQATASKGGRSMTVGLDYKGNITAQ